jgi:hypothetical protein
MSPRKAYSDLNILSAAVETTPTNGFQSIADQLFKTSFDLSAWLEHASARA